VVELWSFICLLLGSFGLGAAALLMAGVSCEDDVEFAALAITAGLGIAGVLLGVLGLFGWLHAGRYLLPLFALGAFIWIALNTGRWRSTPLRWPTAGMALLIAADRYGCCGLSRLNRPYNR